MASSTAQSSPTTYHLPQPITRPPPITIGVERKRKAEEEGNVPMGVEAASSSSGATYTAP